MGSAVAMSEEASIQTSRGVTAYMLSTFLIVRRKDKEKFKWYYRYKFIIYEICDPLNEFIRTGHPCQILFSPPPTDPRHSHPLSEG